MATKKTSSSISSKSKKPLSSKNVDKSVASDTADSLRKPGITKDVNANLDDRTVNNNLDTDYDRDMSNDIEGDMDNVNSASKDI